MKVWLPVIRSGTGTDVFTRRLAVALQSVGVDASISWFEPHFELYSSPLKSIDPPAGTQIIHANAWNGFAFHRPNYPLVVTEHQGPLGRRTRPYKNKAQYLYHRFWARRRVAASLRAARAVTAVSHFAAAELRAATRCSSIHTIYNFIDPTLFAPSGPAHRNSRQFRLLYVGNLSYLKGADMLPSIMTRLGRSFHLDYTSGLKVAPAIQKTENMHSIGRLENDAQLVAAYRACDAVIVPSRFEGFGYTVLEAMACGKPVIASGAGAIPEVLGERAGILCEPGNVEAFVAACRRLADDPTLCRELGEAGRARALAEFSTHTVLPRYLTLYRSIV